MKRATGFTAVLMAAAMVFTMAGCGSSKDADTSAKKETKTEDSKDKENSDKQFIVGLMQNILHMDIKMTMANM